MFRYFLISVISAVVVLIIIALLILLIHYLLEKDIRNLQMQLIKDRMNNDKLLYSCDKDAINDEDLKRFREMANQIYAFSEESDHVKIEEVVK